ncbi:MAG TPA: DegT/DnrJ/EryC1/StrS family aminotransferase [Ignavibacteria bacterium]|nr:capsular biosynthesis protein [Bacteroidota bacterium]HRI84453.1 DegT/DnrJ/EryC1/StrS family aminotransferase [Ignavibacteria bacterium]HRJ98550.1 DegT/DnrJ/EryC1/StrS family aminotransferase [Ignavibacteria bacterium]
MIPFSPPYIDGDVINEVLDSLNSGWITTGPKVKALETEVAKLTGVKNVLCVNSATSAMMLMLHWFGVGKGDEVIIPSYTYCATALAVMHLGASPVMADSDKNFCMNVSKIKNLITEKTKAIVPVDIAGFPCDYDEIYEIINEPEIKNLFKPANETQKKLGRIFVMSDAAHSIGAVYKGKESGSLCDVSVFSFHAVKNVTTAEGGAICLNLPDGFDNGELYKWLRLLSLNGQTKDAFTKSLGGNWKYDIVYPGFKINLNDLCAAVGLAQIRKYSGDLLLRRREIFEKYNDFFSKTGWAQLPPSKDKIKETSYHIYLLRINGISEEQRDKIIEEINKREVAVNVHFIPLPMLTVFRERNFKIEDFPESYGNYSRVITLPVYPQLSDADIKIITESVRDSYNAVLKS